MPGFAFCPQCKKATSISSSKTSTKTTLDPTRCRFELNGRRCPLPGTMSPSPYAKENWYCNGHWLALGDSKISEAILRDAEARYGKFTAADDSAEKNHD